MRGNQVARLRLNRGPERPAMVFGPARERRCEICGVVIPERRDAETRREIRQALGPIAPWDEDCGNVCHGCAADILRGVA